MSSILPSLSTAVAGASNPGGGVAAARENPAANAAASTQAVSKHAVDKSKGPEPRQKARAPAAQKRTESAFAGQGAKPRASADDSDAQEAAPTVSTHDGKLDIVA